MAKILKYGGHRYSTHVPAQAALGAEVTQCALIYDFNNSAWGTYDWSQEAVSQATYIATAAITGQNTNYASIDLIHYSVAGAIVDRVQYAFTLGVNATAFVPIDLTAAPAVTGNPLSAGWVMNAGDSIWAGYLQTGASGLAMPLGNVQYYLGAQGA